MFRISCKVAKSEDVGKVLELLHKCKMATAISSGYVEDDPAQPQPGAQPQTHGRSGSPGNLAEKSGVVKRRSMAASWKSVAQIDVWMKEYFTANHVRAMALHEINAAVATDGDRTKESVVFAALRRAIENQFIRRAGRGLYEVTEENKVRIRLASIPKDGEQRLKAV